jgi:branched-chain amino acid transport system permease protein
VHFFLALLVDGALSGAIYALVALAFVIVYKASRMINFALGEWMMVGAGLVAAGLHALQLGLAAALGGACAGMMALALAFNRVVLRPLVGRPLISLIMVTLGLGVLLSGTASLALGGIPRRIPFPIPQEPLVAYGLVLATEKVVAAAIAAAAIAIVTGFFRWSRTGLALRAIANDQQLAMATGIDIQRYFAITWALAGVITVLAGTLWTFIAGGGFSVVLLGLKVFPVVIVGGLDSIPGTIVGAVLVGVVESVAGGYLDPVLGGGVGPVASYVVLIAMLFARPYGLFGRAEVVRV